MATRSVTWLTLYCGFSFASSLMLCGAKPNRSYDMLMHSHCSGTLCQQAPSLTRKRAAAAADTAAAKWAHANAEISRARA